MSISYTVQQLSVFLENRAGRLDDVLKVLSEGGVNIVALSLADTADYGLSLIHISIDIPGLCRAMGIKNVVEVNAFDIETLEKTIREEVAKDEVSVIITKSPCVLLSKEKKPLYTAHSDKCKKCGMCMKPGCPAMTKNADGTVYIDDTMCTGCGLCEKLCKFNAIELVKAGEE